MSSQGGGMSGFRMLVGVLFVVVLIVTVFSLIHFVLSTLTWVIEIAVVVGLGALVWHLFVNKRST